MPHPGDVVNPFDPFPHGLPRPSGPGGRARNEADRRRLQRHRQREARAAVAALVAIPLPVPAGPGAVPTFPNIPAANQPFPPEIITAGALGRIVLGGVIGGIVIETARQILKRKKKLDDDRKKREDDARNQRRSPDEPLREVIIRPIPPEPGVEPGRIILNPFPELPDIGRPAPLEIPQPRVDFPSQTPEIAPIPGPEIPTIPETSPSPSQAPAPKPVPGARPIPGFGVPGPLPLPGASPFPVGFPLPGPVAFPKFLPVGFPTFTPVGDPLTGFEPLGVASQGPQLGFIELPEQQPAAQAQTQRCENVKNRRRKKGKCREGFFRERPGDTQFVTWRENDCS